MFSIGQAGAARQPGARCQIALGLTLQPQRNLVLHNGRTPRRTGEGSGRWRSRRDGMALATRGKMGPLGSVERGCARNVWGVAFLDFLGVTMRSISYCSLLAFSIGSAKAQTSGADSASIIVGLVILALSLVLYFLPSIIGSKRGISSSGALFFVNLLLGWTGLGWLFCMIWAATGATRAQDAYYRNASARPDGNSASNQAYQDAYARERARLDHEEQSRARRQGDSGR